MTNTAELESLKNSEHETTAEVKTGDEIIGGSYETIHLTEDKISRELNVPLGTSEIVELTDEVLAGKATHEMSSNNFTEEERMNTMTVLAVEAGDEKSRGANGKETA